MAALVVDLHSDTILDLQAGRRTLDQRSAQGHIDLPRMREGGLDLQVFAMYVAPRMAARGPARLEELLKTFHGVVKANA
ncbi:MAG: membrane dipeptidase, partial [Armatimonadetes bacterium]|nr:membrane dipeptidase [Armatimonadota bacterium]